MRPVDFQLYVEVRSGRLRQVGGLALAWGRKKNAGCGRGRIDFFLTGSESRAAMGFGSGEGWGRWTSSCRLGSGAGSCGSWVDSHWHGVEKNVGCGEKRIDFILTGSESDVRQQNVWFREPRRLALLYGVWERRRVGSVDFQLYVRLRSGRLRQLGGVALTGMGLKKKCGL